MAEITVSEKGGSASCFSPSSSTNSIQAKVGISSFLTQPLKTCDSLFLWISVQAGYLRSRNMLASSKDIDLEVNGTGRGHLLEGNWNTTGQLSGQRGGGCLGTQIRAGKVAGGYSWVESVHQILEVNLQPALLLQGWASLSVTALWPKCSSPRLR